MKIAHITDIHYNDSMSAEVDADAMENLNRILDDIRDREIGRVVMTGDYGDPSGFDEIIESIKAFGLDYNYILGNHDDSSLFRNRADFNGLYYAQGAAECRMIFLDTGSAVISVPQLNFLEAELDTAGDYPVMIFTHHPVLYCGNRFMDVNHPLENRGAVVKLLSKFDNDISVFSGHYHSEYTVFSGNIRQWVTLSAMCQLNGESETFEIGSTDYGYRIIDTESPGTSISIRLSSQNKK